MEKPSMSLLNREPLAAVASMEELLAIAYAMGQEKITGYSKLAEKMRQEHTLELAVVFDRLVDEQTRNLGSVVRWSEKVSGKHPDLSNLRWKPENFDDEGAATMAPELLSAYRAFSMAVRNEERAFLIWTYVAAHAERDELRKMAEQMAREQLEHLATLRRERRHAYHLQRAVGGSVAKEIDLVALELKLSDHLVAAAAKTSDSEAIVLKELARQARVRSGSLHRKPLGAGFFPSGGVAVDFFDRMAALCEFILDTYIDFGERLQDENDRSRAQKFAAEVLRCRSAIRSTAY